MSMVNKLTQHKKIWDYLCKHPEGITPYEAFVHLKITKLSTRIGEMIKDGYKIKKLMEYKITENGTYEHYMRYGRADNA